jgi:hypothetical protein
MTFTFLRLTSFRKRPYEANNAIAQGERKFASRKSRTTGPTGVVTHLQPLKNRTKSESDKVDGT